MKHNPQNIPKGFPVEKRLLPNTKRLVWDLYQGEVRILKSTEKKQ